MHNKNVLSAANPVKCDRLMQVSFSYWDFDGRRHDDGNVVVLDVVAPQVQAIFNALLQRGFPLGKAIPVGPPSDKSISNTFSQVSQ